MEVRLLDEFFSFLSDVVLIKVKHRLLESIFLDFGLDVLPLRLNWFVLDQADYRLQSNLDFWRRLRVVF